MRRKIKAQLRVPFCSRALSSNVTVYHRPSVFGAGAAGASVSGACDEADCGGDGGGGGVVVSSSSAAAGSEVEVAAASTTGGTGVRSAECDRATAPNACDSAPSICVHSSTCAGEAVGAALRLGSVPLSDDDASAPAATSFEADVSATHLSSAVTMCEICDRCMASACKSTRCAASADASSWDGSDADADCVWESSVVGARRAALLSPPHASGAVNEAA